MKLSNVVDLPTPKTYSQFKKDFGFLTKEDKVELLKLDHPKINKIKIFLKDPSELSILAQTLCDLANDRIPIFDDPEIIKKAIYIVITKRACKPDFIFKTYPEIVYNDKIIALMLKYDNTMFTNYLTSHKEDFLKYYTE